MAGPSYWGVAGDPISHSITPDMFRIVGGTMGIPQAESSYFEVREASDLIGRASLLDGELWISCTSPLKHSVGEALRFVGPDGLSAVNQLKRSNGEWSGENTDGIGFISACNHIGIRPSDSILRMRGGGSTARSIAAAWSEEGGSIILESGRRPLGEGPWDGSVIESGNATLSIDLDAPPGGGISVDLEAGIQLSISYSEDSTTEDFAVMMVAAQHLEAWRSLFAPEMTANLPTLSELLTVLRETMH